MTKYQQIISDINQAIENHTYKRGQKLPSVRQLSQAYQDRKSVV